MVDYTILGEATPTARLKSGADKRDSDGTPTARRDFRPTARIAHLPHRPPHPIAATRQRGYPAKWPYKRPLHQKGSPRSRY
jgi:hypothetical protein